MKAAKVMVRGSPSHKSECKCTFCTGGNEHHQLDCSCAFCTKTGPRSHKDECMCSFCVGGTSSHRLDCGCFVCSKSGGGLDHHKSNCSCPFCVGGNDHHKPECQCSFCGPPVNRGAVHRDDCTCPFCSGTHPGNSDTGIELAMQKLLTQLGIDFETQARFGPYRVDIYIPDVGLVIECDGDYWHSFEDPKKRARRDRYIRRQGLKLWHFTEAEINRGCERRLRRALVG